MERLKKKERLERAKRVQTLREITKLSRREFAKKQVLLIPFYSIGKMGKITRFQKN